jgi:hypothetical protein
MTKRKSIPKEIETKIFSKSRRRCCICFHINNDFDVKQGQIAHLDGNNENWKFENLAFLCLEHHDQYDSKTSQSKNYTIQEVKHYREKLYIELEQWDKRSEITYKQNEKSEHKKDVQNDKKNIDKEYENLKNIIVETKKDFENFKFSSNYDYRSYSKSEIVKEISGKDAVSIFIKQFHRILKSCVDKERKLQKEHLDNTFIDGIEENIIGLKILLETIIDTNKFIINLSQTYKEKYFFLYDLKKYFRYLLNNLLNSKKGIVEIEKELLPKAINLCEVARMNVLGLEEILNYIMEINICLEKINDDYNWFLLNFKKNQEGDEEENDAIVNRAAILITKDIFGKLREFAKATTGNKLEIAIPQLISSTNIEDYVKNITKQEINIINYDSIDDIKRSLENLGHFYKSTTHWYPVPNYERTKEGQIYFAITGDENKVFINAEGLEILNSYLTAFKKEFLKS